MKIHDIDIPVYETTDSQKYLLWSDLKLALTKPEYEQLAMKQRSDTYPVKNGLLVEDVKRVLTKKWK
jgi:hypothetical protein